jgi:hypothetical protein
MVVFLSAAVISCSQAMSIIHRLTNVVGLTESQKYEIIQEIRKTIPFCPVKVVKDDGRNSGR